MFKYFVLFALSFGQTQVGFKYWKFQPANWNTGRLYVAPIFGGVPDFFGRVCIGHVLKS